MLVLSNSTDKEKPLWSTRTVNLARQVTEVWRNVEMCCFNDKPELLVDQRAFFLSPVDIVTR